MNLYTTAAIVTVFSAFEHCLGFLYRIVLSRVLGPEGLGVYQVALTVFSVFLTVCSSGLPVTLSRVISKHRAAGNVQGEHAAATAAMLASLLVSLPVTLLLFALRTPFSRIFSDPRCADLFYILLFGLSFTSLYSVIRGTFWGNKRFFAYSLVELAEEIAMIVIGVLLLLVFRTGIADVNKAAVAVLLSHLLSFALAAVLFVARGGKLRSPRGEFLPLLRASVPVTATRASSSLVSSLISVLFPMRLMEAGVSSSQAMSAYGVVYGMVMPVIFIPGTLISSLALVLVPELAECYYKNKGEKLSALVKKALDAALLIAGILVPFFAVCGESLGVLLYGSAESGILISRSALLLFPMSLTMIATSMLNSMNCEKYTLLFFLLGSAAMLLAVWFLSPVLGNGALLVGMACDHTLTAGCSLLLLAKKTGKLRSGGYFLRVAAVVVLSAAPAYGLRSLLMGCLGYLPALVLVILFTAAAELVLLRIFRLFDFSVLAKKFLPKRKRPA